jgi:hypothetical protein
MQNTTDNLTVRLSNKPARRRRQPADPAAQVQPYGARTFAAYDRAGQLLAVTVYKKGARTVVDRLTALETENERLRAQLAAHVI